MRNSQKQLKKSYSIGSLKVKFDHKEFEVGNSKIDKLPLRRQSLQATPTNKDDGASRKKKERRIETEVNELERIRYKVEMLQRLNESLTRQNQTLKRQVAFLNQTANSRRSSIIIKNTHENSGYKEKILNRLNKKRDGFTMTPTDNDSTGLFTNKEGNSKIQEETVIAEMYDGFYKKRILPSLQNLYEVAKSYFNEFKENYLKLKILSDHVTGTQKTPESRQIQDLLFLFQVPILFKDNPRGLIRTISQQKLQNPPKNSKRQQKSSEFCPELYSPSQNLAMLESSLKITLNSSKMLEKFKHSQIFLKLLKKVKEV